MRNLTDKERDTLRAAWQSASAAEAAESLGITLTAYNARVGKIYGKLGVSGLVPALRKAIHCGFLDAGV